MRTEWRTQNRIKKNLSEWIVFVIIIVVVVVESTSDDKLTICLFFPRFLFLFKISKKPIWIHDKTWWINSATLLLLRLQLLLWILNKSSKNGRAEHKFVCSLFWSVWQHATIASSWVCTTLAFYLDCSQKWCDCMVGGSVIRWKWIRI